MVLWSLAELRHAAPACFDALADAGTAALSDPARRKRFASHELAVCLWVSPTLPAAAPNTMGLLQRKSTHVPNTPKRAGAILGCICRRMGG